MTPRQWIAAAALSAAVGVGCGAFGAHALAERLEAADQVDNWRTAVSYQVWHALALLGFALYQERRACSSAPAWCFVGGTLFFSGSIYCLALEVLSSVVWPFTPLGGVLLLIGWVLFAVTALRGSPAHRETTP